MTAPSHDGAGTAGHRLYLLRHARAEPKKQWTGPDHVRPLTRAGRGQAELLVAQLLPCPVRRVVTSPTARCRQTVEPLARARGLAVEEAPALGVGSTVAALRQLAAEPGMDDAVWCTHGEVLHDLLGWLAPTSDGEPPLPAEKGSIWLLHDLAGTPRLGSYLPPPPGRAGSR